MYVVVSGNTYLKRLDEGCTFWTTNRAEALTMSRSFAEQLALEFGGWVLHLE